MNSNYKCIICGRPATIYVTETINGVTTKKYYCEHCRSMMDSGGSLQDVLSGLFGMSPKPKQSNLVCKCGCSERYVVSTGKFGCSECYTTFRHLANDYLASKGNLEHKGSSPIMDVGNMREIDKLTAQLEKAISEQRYLDADSISKQIKELEK